MIATLLAAAAAVGLARIAARPRARSLAGRPERPRRVEADHHARRRGWAVGCIAAAVVGVVVVGVVAVLVGGTLTWLARRRRRDRRAAADQRKRRDELVETAEILAIGLRNGLLALEVCRSIPQRLDGDVADALDQATRRHDRGSPLDDSLRRALDPLGPDAAALAAIIGSSAVDGAAVADSLDELAGDLRRRLHLEIETAARQLPVRMLGPLVTCILPGFLALTVVPVVLDSVGALLA